MGQEEIEVYKNFKDMRFCKLQKGKKIPIGKNWTESPLTFSEVKEHGSFGILGGFGGYFIIDIDKNLQEATEIIKKFIPLNTFAVETGSSTLENQKIHLYYKISDPEHLSFNRYHKYGEFIWHGFQVVSAGQIHSDTKNFYKIKLNEPIKEVKSSSINSLINEIGEKKVQIKEFELDKKKSIISEDNPYLEDRDCEYIRMMLDNSEIFDAISSMSNIRTNDMIYPNLAGFIKYNPEYKQKAYEFAEKSKTNGVAELEGWINHNAGLNCKEFKNYLINYNLIDLFKPHLLKPTTLKNYLTYDEIVKDFLILNYLEQGTLCTMIGEGGGGKSILSAYEACCIASGELFFDNPTKQGKVLIINNENKPNHERNRYAAIIKGMQLDVNPDLIHFRRYKQNLLHELDDLEDYIKEHNIIYVIIDTFRSHFHVDENSAGEVSAITSALKNIVTSTNCTIKFIHHLNKSDNFSGTTAFKTNVDELALLTSKHHTDVKFGDSIIDLKFKSGKERYSNLQANRTIRLEIINKDVEWEFEGEQVKTKIPDIITFKYVDDNVIKQSEKEKFRIHLLNSLKNDNKELSELISDTEFNKNSAKMYIKQFIQEGFIEIYDTVGRTNYYKLKEGWKNIINDKET